MSAWVHIIGAGPAGLSLAKHLASFPKLPGNVVVSDPNRHGVDKKRYAFWFQEKERELLNPSHAWSSWTMSSKSNERRHKGKRYHYGHISGQAFRRDCEADIYAHGQILLDDEPINAHPDAEFVFDSRPVPQDNFWIKQCFSGVLLQTEKPHGFFDVQLMSDIEAFESGVNFRYMLPLGPRDLLIEYTDFTSGAPRLDRLREQTQNWIQHKLNVPHWVLDTEEAVIPMGFTRPTENFGIPIGIRGDAGRVSTGYSFRQNMIWAKKAASRLLLKGKPMAVPRSLREDWMDKKLLWLIKERPDLVPAVFMQLASRLKGDQFAAFMTENTLMDAFRVILSSPKGTFLRALFGGSSWK